MTPEDRLEVREMLKDIISGPLENLNGKLSVLVQQTASIETQTLKTNGRVTASESKINAIELLIAKDLPHTVATCPQGEIIKTLSEDVARIKTTKANEGKSKAERRSTITIVILASALVVSIVLGILGL